MSRYHSRGRSTGTMVLEEDTESCSPPTTISVSQRKKDDLYPVALLKIAMEMKKLEPTESVQFEEILERVLNGMVVDKEDFGRYLSSNFDRLVCAAKKGRY